MTVTSALPMTASPPDTSLADVLPGPTESSAAHQAAPATAPLTAAVVGASGFTGALLAELLLRHPGVALEQMSSEQLAGAPVAEHLPRLHTGLSFSSPAEIGGVDVAFVCAPHGQAAHVVEPPARRRRARRRPLRRLQARRRRLCGLVPAAPVPRASARGGLRADRAVPPGGRRSDARRQPGLLPDGCPARPGAARAPGAARRRDRRQVGRERRRQDGERAHALLQRRGDLVAYGLGGHRHYPEIVGGLAALAACAASRRSPSCRTSCRWRAASSRRSTCAPRACRSAATLRALYEEAYAGEAFVALATRRPSSRTWSAPTTAASLPRSTSGPARDRGRRHRQPHEGRRRPGGPEPERHGRLPRALGARMTVLQRSAATPRKGPASAMTLPLEGCGPSDLLPQSRFVTLPAGVEQAGGSVTHPRGFRAAGLHAGLKRSGNRDVGVLVSDLPCSSAVLFTTNAAAAAPVRLTRGSSSCERLRGVVVNSGNANACTGKRGLGDAARMRRVAADASPLPRRGRRGLDRRDRRAAAHREHRGRHRGGGEDAGRRAAAPTSPPPSAPPTARPRPAARLRPGRDACAGGQRRARRCASASPPRAPA